MSAPASGVYPPSSPPTFFLRSWMPLIFRGCAIVPLHLSAVTGAALPGKEGQRAVTGRLELPVRHLCCGLVELEGCREVVSRALQVLTKASAKFVARARRVCGRAAREPRRALVRASESWRDRPGSKLHAATRWSAPVLLIIQQICVRRSWRAFGCCWLTAATVRRPWSSAFRSEDVLVDRSQTNCGACLELFVSSACRPGAIFLIVPEPVGR